MYFYLRHECAKGPCWCIFLTVNCQFLNVHNVCETIVWETATGRSQSLLSIDATIQFIKIAQFIVSVPIYYIKWIFYCVRAVVDVFKRSVPRWHDGVMLFRSDSIERDLIPNYVRLSIWSACARCGRYTHTHKHTYWNWYMLTLDGIKDAQNQCQTLCFVAGGGKLRHFPLFFFIRIETVYNSWVASHADRYIFLLLRFHLRLDFI